MRGTIEPNSRSAYTCMYANREYLIDSSGTTLSVVGEVVERLKGDDHRAGGRVVRLVTPFQEKEEVNI